MAASPVEITQARPEDAASLFPLIQLYPPSIVPRFEAFEKSYLSILKEDDVEFWLARSGDSVLGFILAFHHPSLFTFAYTTWIEEIMVAEAERKRGLGRLLVEWVEARAIAKDSKMIGLATESAPGFYQAMGYGKGADYMRKILS